MLLMGRSLALLVFTIVYERQYLATAPSGLLLFADIIVGSKRHAEISE